MRFGGLLLVAILAACGASPEPTIQPTASLPTEPPTPTLPSEQPSATLPGEPVQVNVHCGLGWPVIEYGGSHWKFDAPGVNPPPGWTGMGDTIYIRTLDDGTVQALGPDGLVYQLVETDKTQPDTGCM